MCTHGATRLLRPHFLAPKKKSKILWSDSKNTNTREDEAKKQRNHQRKERDEILANFHIAVNYNAVKMRFARRRSLMMPHAEFLLEFRFILTFAACVSSKTNSHLLCCECQHDADDVRQRSSSRADLLPKNSDYISCCTSASKIIIAA